MMERILSFCLQVRRIPKALPLESIVSHGLMQKIKDAREAGRLQRAFHAISTSVVEQHKAAPYVSEFRMVSCDKIKRDRASVASPAPFEIPARFLSGEFLAPAFRRMLRSPEWCPTSSDDLGVISII